MYSVRLWGTRVRPSARVRLREAAGLRPRRAASPYLWAAALAFGALFAWTGPAAAKVSLVLGTYAPDKPTAMVKQLQPAAAEIAGHMSEILDEEVEIKLKVVRGYAAGIDLIVDGQVDFMRLGPAAYVMAKDRNAGLSVLAMEKKRGSNQFRGVIAVHEDSDITEVSQLRGRSFAFGNERSTLGRFFAQLHLMRAGIHADHLSRFEYLGRHDKVGRAVGSGLFDAGALEETTFGKLVAKGVKIRAIASYVNATRPWVGRAGLEPRIEEALREAMMRLSDPDALKSLRFDGFVAGNDSEYDATREAIQKNPRFFTQISQQ